MTNIVEEYQAWLAEQQELDEGIKKTLGAAALGATLAHAAPVALNHVKDAAISKVESIHRDAVNKKVGDVVDGLRSGRFKNGSHANQHLRATRWHRWIHVDPTQKDQNKLPEISVDFSAKAKANLAKKHEADTANEA